jgi:hypothetical protein
VILYLDRQLVSFKLFNLNSYNPIFVGDKYATLKMLADAIYVFFGKKKIFKINLKNI